MTSIRKLKLNYRLNPLDIKQKFLLLEAQHGQTHFQQMQMRHLLLVSNNSLQVCLYLRFYHQSSQNLNEGHDYQRLLLTFYRNIKPYVFY